jgi:hypothetical protein
MDHISKYTKMETESNYIKNFKFFIIFLTGIVVGIFSFWIWTATQNELSSREIVGTSIQNELNYETGFEEEITNALELEVNDDLWNDAIFVKNQPAGFTVFVEKVTFEEGGWIVIHEGTASHIGNALGALRFYEGIHSGTVELLRSTERGNMYRAVLYRDNGDKKFDLDSDFPFLQDGNQPILTTFYVE